MPEAGANSPDSLNQADIDRLMQESPEGAKAPVFRADGTPFRENEVSVEAFDFRTPIFLAEAELRRLRIISQDFVRALSAKFSAFLRTDFNFKMSKLTTMPWEKFAETIHNPSHITLFKAEPLPGIAVLEIEPRLAMDMANRMLGGKGPSSEGDRYLTEIEIALLEEVVNLITGEWCAQWRDEPDLEPKMLGHETNARFLHICPKNTIMLALAMEVQSGETAETLQIGVPYPMIEPIVKKLQGERQKQAGAAPAADSLQWRNSYDEINIPVVADWSIPGLSLSDVARLRLGDVLQLPRSVVEQTRVRIAGAARFTGRAGKENGRLAVQLNTRVIA